MSIRIKYQTVMPELAPAIRELDKIAKDTGLDPKLHELIKIRASQINGCAFCLDMHTRDARAAGETEQRIYTLSAWREAPYYTDIERAVLELTEAVTNISAGGVSDELYARVRAHFDEKQFMGLLASMAAINVWNRIAISIGLQPAERRAPAEAG